MFLMDLHQAGSHRAGPPVTQGLHSKCGKMRQTPQELITEPHGSYLTQESTLGAGKECKH